MMYGTGDSSGVYSVNLKRFVHIVLDTERKVNDANVLFVDIIRIFCECKAYNLIERVKSLSVN